MEEQEIVARLQERRLLGIGSRLTDDQLAELRERKRQVVSGEVDMIPQDQARKILREVRPVRIQL